MPSYSQASVDIDPATGRVVTKFISYDALSAQFKAVKWFSVGSFALPAIPGGSLITENVGLGAPIADPSTGLTAQGVRAKATPVGPEGSRLGVSFDYDITLGPYITLTFYLRNLTSTDIAASAVGLAIDGFIGYG